MINDIPVSAHFSLREFEDRTTHQVMLDPNLVQKLEALRALVGVPITVTSGYRTPAHNAQVGGAQDSQHELGKAADIVWSGIEMETAVTLAEQVGFTGIGSYADGHLHVDVRDVQAGGVIKWTG